VVQNAQGQTETYTTTSEHPFWVTNGPANGQWLKASLLQAGLHLTNAQGDTLEVISQTALEKTGTVYNIEVHEHSTYHVGEMGVWVHNAKCCEVKEQLSEILASSPVVATERGVISPTKIHNNGISVELNVEQKGLLERAMSEPNAQIRGELTEDLVTNIAKSHGATVLDSKYGSNNGIDQLLIFKDSAGELIVMDTKQMLKRGTVLNQNAAGGHRQLSDNWLKEVGERLGKDHPTNLAILAAIENKTLVKVVASPDRANNTVNFVRVIVPNKVEK
jgi:filamentous hemagglutinin